MENNYSNQPINPQTNQKQPNNNSINISATSPDAKKTNVTKTSDDSREFRELNKEIFQIIQQGGNTSGASITNKSNSSVGAVSITDNTWAKKSSHDDAFEPKKDNLQAQKNKKQIHTMIPNPLKDKEEEKKSQCEQVNFICEENDEVPNTEEKINQLHIQECKTNNLSEIDSCNYSKIKNNNFILKSNFPLYNNNNSNNGNNIVNNNPMQNQQNIINRIMYQNFNKFGSQYYYNSYLYPENAFTYNDNIPPMTSNIYTNTNKVNATVNQKRKKKYKEKFDQTLFMINLEEIIKGRDIRTTVMIRHIPNKYSTENLLEEIDVACNGKYDFFYLPIDEENNLNLGYSFINFIDPLHIIYFYHLFKARKWNYYKSNKECDLSFAKFQGKIELTAHLGKNNNKLDENKKLPLLFNVKEPHPKVDMPKEYFEYISLNRPEILESLCFK